MTVSIDTLKKLADLNPFQGNYAVLGEREVLRRFEEAGVMQHLARQYNETAARNLASDGAFQQPTNLVMERLFFRGQGGRYFLKSDINGRADGSKITEAAIKRVGQEDPELARAYARVQQEQGSEAVFQQIATAVRRHDLAQVSGRGSDLADVDEVMVRRNRGRAM
ncbi:hypothetical protein [Stenotrophomonas maltophilia]|uniref:Uncharacterized protein n=1 Tax=Stenotrophomonas maltophilia TaxID=40324 RepID=A0A2W6HX38_STEMA|nr:hypothetical protein [Stenotrophomonas maltophilia]PZS87948.1 hypothetical protein A7X83_16115 [Stenotrophomonas maltophilia]